MEELAERELKKGSTVFLVLALVEEAPRHGYEIAKLIAERSAGVITLHAASLYPLLYKLESRGLIRGRWVERAGQRRRRYYQVTAEGRRALEAQRRGWRAFVEAVDRVAGLSHA